MIGHDVVELADANVFVVDARHDVPVPAKATPRVIVLVSADARFIELERRAIELAGDAFVLGSARIAAAIRWVRTEDRTARTLGPPRLVVIGSLQDDLGRSYAVSGEALTLGRARNLETAGIHVMSSNVARHHAQIRRTTTGVEIRDLASTNGTLLVRRGQPGRLLCPTTYGAELASSAWLIRDRTTDWVPLAAGDEIVVPGFRRFRLDGELRPTTPQVDDT